MNEKLEKLLEQLIAMQGKILNIRSDIPIIDIARHSYLRDAEAALCQATNQIRSTCDTYK
jgi:hypothetical protein